MKGTQKLFILMALISFLLFAFLTGCEVDTDSNADTTPTPVVSASPSASPSPSPSPGSAIINITVVNEATGAPMEGVEVSLMQGGNSIYDGFTDINGEYRVIGAPGTYDVILYQEDPYYYETVSGETFVEGEQDVEYQL